MGISPEDIFPVRGYIFWSWRLTHRGGGRIFAVFWPRTSKKQRYFGNLLCALIIAFFRTRQSRCKTKFQKKSLFWGISRMYFSSCFLFLVMFLHCAFWVVHDVRLGVRKNAIFSAPFFRREKVSFFRTPKKISARDNTVLFGSSALMAERNTILSSNTQTCQFKTTNVKIHPAVPKVYTHLIYFGQMEMANASANFGNTLVGLRPWNDAIHDFRRSVQNLFSGIWKMLFFRATAPGWRVAGWLSGWLAGYLAGSLAPLAGWLYGGLLASWLARALAIWPSGWLPTCLSGWLTIWLAGWLAIWLADWLAGWRVGWPTGELAGWLFGWLSGWLVGYLLCYVAIWLAVVACSLAGWLGGGLLAG